MASPAPRLPAAMARSPNNPISGRSWPQIGLGGGHPGKQSEDAGLGYAYAAAGRALDARRILKELQSLARQQYVSSFGIALIHDALGEKEPALAAFEQAYQ